MTRTVSYEPFFSYLESNKPKDFKTEYIVSVMNCRATAERCTVLSLTPNARSIAIEFSWEQRQNYVWGNPIADWPYITVIGDMVYSIPGTYQEQIVGDKPDTFTLSFLRGRDGAKEFAEREYKRAKVAPTTYSFQALQEHVPGNFYRIVDTVTGIDVVVRILACATDADGICSIKAESADYIGMSVDTENLKLRDNLDVAATVILTSDKSLINAGMVTVTAGGRLMEIIDNENPATFQFDWTLNGEPVPEWAGLKQVTAMYSRLETGSNLFGISVSHIEGGQSIVLGTSSLSVTKVVEGVDGASAEIQYAIGSSITEPPMDEMLWGGIEMVWDGDPMLWQQGMWGDEVPEMQRGQYIWMRSRVGDSPWQYTRLTGTTSWDVEGLGVATTACPTESREGLPLIPGDYFIAGATFTDPVDSQEYRKGFAYEYTGSGWQVLDLMDSDNSAKALQCLSDLMTSRVNVTDSTASIYGWFQYLVAQSAVIEQLVAEVAVLKQLIVTGDIDNDAITTTKATSAISLSSLLTSSQNYYYNGVLQGTCPQILASTIASLLPLGLSYATSGSITINGTTITATNLSPVKFERTTSSLIINSAFRYYADGYLNGYSPSNGYWMCRGGDNVPITSNSLMLPTSDGTAYVHDLIPKGVSDNVGTSNQPFLNGHFSNLAVPSGKFNYKPSQVSTGVHTFTTDGTWNNVIAISNDITMIMCEALYPISGSTTLTYPITVPYPSSNGFSTVELLVPAGDVPIIFSFRKSGGYIQAKIDYLPTGVLLQARVRSYK